jgi:hypothetical protein
MLPIRQQILDALERSGNRRFLEGVVAKMVSDSDVVRFVHRYSVFNGNFAGGVAALAGSVHLQQHLFRDPDEPIGARAEIASQVFFAAEDEYSVRGGGPRWTHRRLGQQLLEHTLRFFEVPRARFLAEFQLNPALEEILAGVVSGYCIGTEPSEVELFDALGFHLGAELLAHVEFNVLHDHLRHQHPGYVEHLLGTDIGHGVNAYHWIGLHTHVEKEHFDGAVTAAELALTWYAGAHDAAWVADSIVAGFEGFIALQQRYFARILDA